jgi:hypothetical protein
MSAFQTLPQSQQAVLSEGYNTLQAAFKRFLEQKTEEANGSGVTITRADAEDFIRRFKEEEEARRKAEGRG